MPRAAISTRPRPSGARGTFTPLARPSRRCLSLLSAGLLLSIACAPIAPATRAEPAPEPSSNQAGPAVPAAVGKSDPMLLPSENPIAFALPSAFRVCETEVIEPQLRCQIDVADLQTNMFARVSGPPACYQGLLLEGGVENFVIRYEIAERSRGLLRFSGTEPMCQEPVGDAPGCDFGKSPFLGFECTSANGDGRRPACPRCIRTESAFCYANLERSRVDLKVDNVNRCQSSDNAVLRFMVGVKALNPIELGGLELYRLYMTDPTVVQQTSCPTGC